MKVLFVHDRFGAQAGAESNLRHTAAEMNRRGHQLGLVHGRGTGTGEEAWREIFPSRFALSAIDGAGCLRSALAAFRPDLVYVHNTPDLSVAAELAESGRPVVRMVHDHRLFCLRGCKYPTWSRRPCTRTLSLFCVFPCGGCLVRDHAAGRWIKLRWVSYLAKKRELELHRRFCRLVVGSSYMRTELLRNRFAPEQVEVHAPVPPSGPAMTESSFGPGNRIVYAGQIVRGKGVDVLLESLARVRAPFECVILGEGRHRARCEALSRRLGLAGRVHFVGYVPQRVLSAFYSDATMAAVSSVWPEPFGATGLEAMRCGLPVVAFDAGGIREWLLDGVNGFLVPWMDRERYARRIELLLTDKALARRLGERARALAADRFDFGRYIDGLENLFSRVLEENVRGAAA